MFYDPKTESEIVSLRQYLLNQEDERGRIQILSIHGYQMVATSRLTGHSTGFFSVYTLPPNQAVSPDRQVQINKRREQVPSIGMSAILSPRKTRSLVRGLTPEEHAPEAEQCRIQSASS